MFPSATAAATGAPDAEVTYWISVKPSARSSASATYCGAMQIPGDIVAKRSVVVSGGVSAANAAGVPTSGAAAANDSVVRNCRRDCVNGIGLPPSNGLPPTGLG
jgi:hypothetical protein